MNHKFILESKLMVICKHLKTEWEQKQAEKYSYSLHMLILCVKYLCSLVKVRIFKIVIARLSLSCKYSCLAFSTNSYLPKKVWNSGWSRNVKFQKSFICLYEFGLICEIVTCSCARYFVWKRYKKGDRHL